MERWHSNTAFGNLTQAQATIWTGQQVNPGVPLYNMALMFTINGPVDPLRFEHSLQDVVDQCDSLRSIFEESDGVVNRRVLTELGTGMQHVDFSSHRHPRERARAWAKDRCQGVLDLATRTFDTALIRLSERDYVWYYNQHHIATDASSCAIVFQHVQRAYELRHGGDRRERQLMPLPAYEDYVAFQRTAWQKNEASRQWFLEKAEIVPPMLYGQSAAKNTKTRRVTMSLGSERSGQLREVAMQKGVRSLTRHASQFNVLATVLFAFLYRISGQTNLAIGAPAHNRPTREFKQTVGMFIEVFPLSIDVSVDETFESLLAKVKTEATSFLRYAQPGASDPRDQRSFNTLLNYITASFGDFCGIPSQAEWLHAGHCDRGHHLRLQVHDFDDRGELVLHFDFNEEVFSRSRQRNAAQHFLRLFDAMLADRMQHLDDVDIVGADDANSKGNDLSCQDIRSVPMATTIVEQFQWRAKQNPRAIALVCRGQQCSYGKLDGLVNRLATEMQFLGVGKGKSVAVCLRRSQAAIVAMLATMKAGAAFVPIDPMYPKPRIEFILRDVDATLLLTEAELLDLLPSFPDSLCLTEEGIAQQTFPAHLSSLEPSDPGPADVAYIIYTSGSTGQPKGVIIPHRCLTHYITWAKDKYVRAPEMSFPLFTSLSFDLTITSVFLPLVSGGRIVVYRESEGRRADLTLFDVIDDNLVDIIKLTPSHLTLIANRDLQTSRIRQLIVGGEDLSSDLARRTLGAFGHNVELHNEYGPTEATVGCIVHTFQPASDDDRSVPIGRPISAMRAYVMNSRLREMPPGVIGELCLSGAGLADGYWNRPELTQQRFVENPQRPGERMYLTGDLARIGEDGVFEYCGRIDQQVKIRGFRVELGEVEAAVASHPLVEGCTVVYMPRSRYSDADVVHCVRCGLPSNYPHAGFDDDGLCHLCSAYDAYKHKAKKYFRTMDDLRNLFEAMRRLKSDDSRSVYDCMALLSGGKDSTYVLCRLVDMGLRVLAFTLDNGYISEQAKANIERVVESLGVEHVFGSTPAMNEIFVDSLQRHANVCQGCFKTIYTLSMQLAKERKIPIIVTGLSRGQFFETRLTEELFTDPDMDVEQIDATILRARKEYHRVDDAVSRLLDVEIFQDDQIFEEVQFVDFYRYCDVSLDELLSYLKDRVPWIRPSDTGRSTNCLINDLGIHVHKLQRGYHNYAFPYSWDVRVGHKNREAALQELDDEIDVAQVEHLMQEIGYRQPPRDEASDARLVAYYVSRQPISPSELRSHVSQELPNFMVPSHFVHLDELPLTANGKVDRDALPDLGDQRPQLGIDYVAPRSDIERLLVSIWEEVLRVDRVGINDNFFDLGGDSIMAIQIVARAKQQGIQIAPGQLFDALTVRALADAAGESTVLAEQGLVVGSVPPTPVWQHFFEGRHEVPSVSHVLVVGIPFRVDVELLSRALDCICQHHDALRIQCRKEGALWRAANPEEAVAPQRLIVREQANSLDAPLRAQWIDRTIEELNASLSAEGGNLIQAALIPEENGACNLVLVVHHLAIDAVSWPILLEDLMSAYEQLAKGHNRPQLPAKTTSFRDWATALSKEAATGAFDDQTAYWRKAHVAGAALIPIDGESKASNLQRHAQYEVLGLDCSNTRLLFEEAPKKQHRVHELLLSALSITLADWAGRDSIQFDVESHGRESFADRLDVSRTVGWFTAIYPIIVTVPSKSMSPQVRLAETLLSVRHRVGSVPQNGLGYGVLRYLHPASLNRQHAYLPDESQVLFNYLGRAEHLLPQNSPLKFRRELALHRPADVPRRYLLEVNVMAIQGELKVVWTYNQQVHDRKTIQSLATQFNNVLIDLLQNVLDEESESAAISRFPQAKLNADRLKKLARVLGKVDSVEERD